MLLRGLVLLALVIGIWGIFKTPSNLIQELKQKTSLKKEAPATSNAVAGDAKPLTAVEEKLRQEASLVGRMDSAPEDTEERLQKWAHTLSKEELEQLEETALDIKKPQDDRFLAVMLMAWSEKAEALENLKDIALAEIDPYLTPNRRGDFERILRMQAVDGMIDLPVHTQNIAKTLQSVAANTGDSTIADRANRALSALHEEAQSPKEQDKAALEKLLKKPKRN